MSETRKTRRHLVILVTVCLVLKAGYILFALYAGTAEKPDYSIPGAQPWQAAFLNNDSGWYLNIAENGYPRAEGPADLGCCDDSCFHQSPWAFMPVFPAAIAGVAAITGLDVRDAAILLAVLLSLAMVAAFYHFAKWYFQGDDDQAFIASILLLLFPFHYFFHTAYTESLFLLLLMASLYGASSGRFALASLAFSLLIVTRPNGLATGPAVAVAVLAFLRAGSNRRDVLKALAWAIVPIAVFGTYLYYSTIRTGDILAFVTAQRGWCKESMPPWQALFQGDSLFNVLNSAYTLGFIALAAAMLFMRRIPLWVHFLVWPGIILPLAAGSVVSMPRYLSVLFPFFLVMGEGIHRSRWRYLLWPALAVLHFWSYSFWLDPGNLLGM